MSIGATPSAVQHHHRRPPEARALRQRATAHTPIATLATEAPTRNTTSPATIAPFLDAVAAASSHHSRTPPLTVAVAVPGAINTPSPVHEPARKTLRASELALVAVHRSGNVARLPLALRLPRRGRGLLLFALERAALLKLALPLQLGHRRLSFTTHRHPVSDLALRSAAHLRARAPRAPDLRVRLRQAVRGIHAHRPPLRPHRLLPGLT